MESLLPDPLGDRAVKDLPLPPQHPISYESLFPSRLKNGSVDIPDWVALKDHLAREGKMLKEHLVYIIQGAINIMSKKSSLTFLFQRRKPMLSE